MTLATELQAIRERVEGASDAPWFAEERNLDEPYSTTTVYNTFHNGDTPDRDLVAEAAYDNAPFIAHARTDLPRLLDAVEAALEVLETEAEAAAKNRLAVDQRDPSMDSATVAMLSGVVLGRLQTTELIRRAITTALEPE